MSHHNDEDHSKASAGERYLGDRRKSRPAEGGSHAGWGEGRGGETLRRLFSWGSWEETRRLVVKIESQDGSAMFRR